MTRPRVHIREKSAGDVAGCLALVRAVHERDDYPRHLPDDAHGFLFPTYETDAWVAEHDGVVVGHVALHDAAVDPTLPAAQRATGLPSDRLAVLARLLVSPQHRGAGLGRELLQTATARARGRGQRAVLDVVQDAAAPVRLYEAQGWQRLEPLSLPIPGGASLDLWVYLAPL